MRNQDSRSCQFGIMGQNQHDKINSLPLAFKHKIHKATYQGYVLMSYLREQDRRQKSLRV